jgi:hypothetical protein
MLTINPTLQSQQLFVASDSLFNNLGFTNLGIQKNWRFLRSEDLIAKVNFNQLTTNNLKLKK